MKTRMKVVLVLASVMTGGVFAMDATDGLVGWWRVNPAAGGAVFNAADLRDDAHAGVTATAVNHQAEDGAYPAVPICHQNVDVTYMAHGKLTAAPCIYFPQPTNYTAEGVCVANRQNVVVPVGDVDIAQGDACTFMIRMKYRGSVSANASGGQDYKAVCGFDYNYGQVRGWRFCLRPDGVNWFYPALYIGNKDSMFPKEFLALNDEWFDIGVVMEPNVPEPGKTRVIYYVWKEFKSGDTQLPDSTFMVSTGSVAAVCSYSAAVASRQMQIGCPEPTSGYEAATAASSSFRGLIHEMKLYRRVLTPEEFKQACGVTSDSLWAIGSKNGSAAEFSDADPAAVFEPATMNWSRFRKTLTAENPSVSIVCNLTEQDREVPRVLELAPMSTDFPAGGRLSVSVNGSVVKTFEPEMGVDKLVYISVNRLKGLTKVGNVYPMTITLTREGVMSGSLSFDRLLIGGWQLGTRNTSAAEFCGWIGNDTYCLNPYYISKGNLKQAFTVLYPGAANPKQNHNEIYFSLSEKMASDCSFVVRMRYEGNTGEFDFFLNGEHLGMKHPAYRADFDIVIPKGVAKAGVNEFKVVQNTRDYSGACNTDYMRFSPVKEWHDPALLLLIR